MIIDIEREDLIISDFLKSLEEWNKYLIIGGGYAPIIYKLYFDNVNTEISPVATRDIDTIIPRIKLKNIFEEKNIDSVLISHGFKHSSDDLLGKPPAEKYIKEIDGIEIEIEFLTDKQFRNHKEKNLKIAGVVAQTLSYIEMSYNEPLSFKTKQDFNGLVVNPAAYIFHKALIFNKRKTGSNKKFKDLYGIWYVGSQLGEFSKNALLKLDEYKINRKTWAKKMNNELKHWLENSSPKDWDLLENQDPSGTLNKVLFKNFIEKIIND